MGDFCCKVKSKLKELLIFGWKRISGDFKNEDWQPDYLKDNSFEKELNFKLWITKNARFNASSRCEELNRNSAKIVGWLSAYVVVLSVLQIIDIPEISFPAKHATFGCIAISILILVYSQMEFSMNYAVKAKEFHRCGLEISELYNQQRELKSNLNEGNVFDVSVKNKILIDISQKYEAILNKYENHSPIDYEIAQIGKYKYFKMSIRKIAWIKLKYFLNVNFQYYIWVYGTPIFYILLKKYSGL